MTTPDDRSRAAGERSASSAVLWSVRVASEWSARLLVVGVGVYVALRLFERVSLVAFAVVLALFFTAVLKPVEGRLRRFGVNRSLATAVVLLGGVVLFGLVAWFVISQITAHSATLADQLSQVGDKIKQWLKTGPLHLGQADLNKYTSNVTGTIKQHQSQLVSGALTTARTVVEIGAGLLLTLFSTFFLLRDGDMIWHWVLRLVPTRARPQVDHAGERGWHTLGGYVRGQVTIAFIHAITIFLLLLILRVPLAAALAVLIFLGAFIPILGLTVTGALCVGVTLLEHGLGAAIAVAIVIVILVQAEGHLLQPLIMSRAVHIHPLAVVLAVAAGTTLYGIVGALIAVPLVAFSNSFVRALRGTQPDPVTEGEKHGEESRPPDTSPGPGPGPGGPASPPPRE